MEDFECRMECMAIEKFSEDWHKYFEEFAQHERSGGIALAALNPQNALQYKNLSLQAPVALQKVDVTSIVDHERHKTDRVVLRHANREQAAKRRLTGKTPPSAEEAEENPKKKPKSSPEQPAEQTTNAEDTGKQQRVRNKPFTAEDIIDEVGTEPLFKGGPGKSVLEVVSDTLPGYTLTGLALDTRNIYKEEKTCKFYQVKKQNKAVSQVSVSKHFGNEQARKAAQVIAILSLNGMSKPDIDYTKRTYIMGMGPSKAYHPGN